MPMIACIFDILPEGYHMRFLLFLWKNKNFDNF
jgi:hypothetical protein